MAISALLASQILDASATGRSVITGADASAIRSTLGLGTLATQSPTGTPSASTFLRGDFSWQTIDLSGYVPYSGATANVDLATRSITASRFLTSSQAVPYTSVDFYAGLYVAKVVSGAGLTFEADMLTIRGINGATTNALSLNGHVTLTTDASDTLAQRRSTNPQVHRVYNTFTDASNYERAKLAWESNILRIGTEKAGTGSARALELQTDGVTRLTIASTGLATFSVKGVFTGAADCLTLVRTGLCSFSLGDANGDTFRIQNAGDSSDMLRIHGTTKLVTIYGNLDVGTRNVVTDTTTGTKIGTATTQKLGFYNATPVVQPTAVADATDAASVITQLNALLSRMRNLGLIAT